MMRVIEVKPIDKVLSCGEGIFCGAKVIADLTVWEKIALEHHDGDHPEFSKLMKWLRDHGICCCIGPVWWRRIGKLRYEIEIN